MFHIVHVNSILQTICCNVCTLENVCVTRFLHTEMVRETTPAKRLMFWQSIEEGPGSDRNVWRSFSVTNMASVASLSVPTFVQTIISWLQMSRFYFCRSEPYYFILHTYALYIYTLYTCVRKVYRRRAAPRKHGTAMTPFQAFCAPHNTCPTMFGSVKVPFVVCVNTHLW